MTIPNQAEYAVSAEWPELVLVEQMGTARWLRLNRPRQRNALNPELVAALDSAVAEAARDEATTVIVIAGCGPSFCAGADLRHLLRQACHGRDPTEFLTAVSDCFTAIEQAPKPVIAAVHGHVVAGGLELALACDVVIAQTGTLIGDGHARSGLVPAGGASLRLPRKVGEPLARWLMLSGELLPAESFVDSGLVHTIAEAETLAPTVSALVDQLSKASGQVHDRVKRLLRSWHDTPSELALAAELAAFAEHWQQSDITGELTRFIIRRRR